MRGSVRVATVAACRTSALEASELDKVFAAVNSQGRFQKAILAAQSYTPEREIARLMHRDARCRRASAADSASAILDRQAQSKDDQKISFYPN